MKLGNYLLATAAAALVASPVMAAPANPAASLSIKSARVGKASAKKNDLAGGGIVVAIIAAAAVVAGIIIVADNDDDSN